jgi:hypothetical protein
VRACKDSFLLPACRYAKRLRRKVSVIRGRVAVLRLVLLHPQLAEPLGAQGETSPLYADFHVFMLFKKYPFEDIARYIPDVRARGSARRRSARRLRRTHHQPREEAMSSYDDRDTAIARDPLQGSVQGPGQVQYGPPQQQYYGYGAQPYGRGFGRGMGMHRGGWSETKPFFMTSEFIGTLLAVIGIAITAASSSDLDSHGASMLIAGLVAAYTVSRGIAKAGTRSRATDPRDDLQLGSHDGHTHS